MGKEGQGVRRDKLSREGGDVIESKGSNEVDTMVVESSSSYLKMQERVNYDCGCSCNAQLGHDLSCVSLSKDGMDFEAGLSLESSEEHANDMQSTVSQLNVEIDRDHIVCSICMLGGEVLCCDGQECKRSFHLSCLDPPLSYAPPGIWQCIWCVQKKIQFGVHSVSEGVESILDAREVESDYELQRQKQYLAKYKGLAHVHNRWIPERQLLLETPLLLAKYKRVQTTRWKIEWTLPHRLLQKRLLCFPKHCDGYLHGHDGKDLDCRYEWLVKWTGLGYDQATWELENAAFMKSPEAVNLIRDFESRHKNAKRVSCLSKEDKGGKITFSELSELPSGGLPGVHDHYLGNINKLRDCWYRGQNAVVFDDQERVLKVILFILSLQDETLPFLIITTSTSLSVWEAAFSGCESSINIVVYKGNKDVRASIRSLEFYNEDGCIMFQVVLSPPDVVVEDLRILEHIKWGVIIVDECQRPRISVHLKKMKDLAAEMRLLLVSGQIKDRKAEYHNLLSFLDSELDEEKENASENDPNYDICILKERLACFVAFECKLHTSRFLEYWVPVQLSNVQLEQYCAVLLSNSMLLCSRLKNDSVDSLREILISTRKCCDHPYLVDVDCSLRRSVTRDLPVAEHLHVEIGVSGKLQLLDKFLLQIKERGLRVLIIFQTIGDSGLITIGDILDDFVHQRFGKDSYARIDGGEIVRSKKQAALDLFNNKETETFVLLIESRACLRSIKLSSVDTIILFDSDWDPLNDLRALQKITVESQFEQLKVFRLYSSHTVEEKVLILAKEGVTLDSNMRNINRSTCHMLLTWGALDLFDKLDDFHSYNASVSHSNIISEESFIKEVVSELSATLPFNSENRHPKNSIIVEVQQTEGAYPSNISLPGEMEAQSVDNFSLIRQLVHNESHVFWTNLLEGRHPRWKFLSGPPQRIRKRTQYIDGLPEETDFKEDTAGRKRRTVVYDTADLICSKPRMKKKRKLHVGSKDSNLAGGCSLTKQSNFLPYSTDKMDNSNCINDSSTVPPAHGISRDSDETNGLTLEQGTVTEIGQHDRAGTPIIGVGPTLELIETGLPTMQPPICLDQGSQEQHQLPVSTNLPSAECGIVSVPASRDVQNCQGSQRHASHQQAQVPTHPEREGSIELSNSSVSQPTTLAQPSTGMPVGGIEPVNSSQSIATILAGDNRSLQASPMPSEVPQSACSDLLQMEMERIQKDKEQAIKMHEDMKLQFKAECEKEINEIRKKYSMLLQDAEKALVQKKKDLETYYNKVYVNTLLAKALTHKYDTKAVGSPGTQEVTVPGFMNEISQLYCQQAAASSTHRHKQSLASLPMTDPPETAPVQVERHSSAVQQTAARTTLGREQSMASFLMTGSPAIPPVQMVDHSLAVQQIAARMTMGPEQSLATLPMIGSPVPPPVQMVTDASAIHQTATRTIMGPQQSSSTMPMTVLPITVPVQMEQTTATTTMRTEQSLASLPMIDPSLATQVVSHSSAAQKTTVRTTLRAEQSLASLPITALPILPRDHSSAVLSTSQHRPACNPMIHLRGNIVAGCEFRAPAPHIRHFRPLPEVWPPYLPPLPDGMPSLQSPCISSVTYCRPTQVTKLLACPSGSISGINELGNNTGLPVIQGSFSGPQLPISIINLPAADLLSQFLMLPVLNSP